MSEATVVEAVIDKNVYCWKCQEKIGDELARPWMIHCQKCHSLNHSPWGYPGMPTESATGPTQSGHA